MRATNPASTAPERPFELREVVDAEGITVELLVEGERLSVGLLGVLDGLSS